MSGFNSQLMYDVCATEQAIAQSTKQFINYDFAIEKFENRPSNGLVSTCDGKFVHIECDKCDYNKDLLENTRSNIDYRITAENDLLGLTRLSSKCDGQRYTPCYVQQVSDCAKWKPIAQPLLCDRSIVPTNMRQFSSAFSYN